MAATTPDHGYACVICDTRLRLLAPCGDRFSYYHCRGCGFVTARPLPSADELTTFYQGFLHDQPSDDQAAARQRGVERDVAKIAQDMRRIAQLDAPLTILDWGGGIGSYASAFAKLGHHCTMIDLDAQACTHARAAFGDRITVINDDPLTYPFTQQFDVVFCNQVIEHYIDAGALLAGIRRVLVPHGVAIITTPNQRCKEFYFRHSWLRHYLGRTVSSTWQLPLAFIRFVRTPWIMCDPPRHLHTFNRTTLTRLTTKCGFQTLSVFAQYSATQYYSPAKNHVKWEYRRPKSLLLLAYLWMNYAGLRVLQTLAPDGRWGDTLVTYARNAP